MRLLLESKISIENTVVRNTFFHSWPALFSVAGRLKLSFKRIHWIAATIFIKSLKSHPIPRAIYCNLQQQRFSYKKSRILARERPWTGRGKMHTSVRPGALAQLEQLQRKNSAARVDEWRGKCYPDKTQQRRLIAKGMSVRFLKGEVLAELQELRDEGGNAAHLQKIHFDIPDRPSTAPAGTSGELANIVKREEEPDPQAHMGRTRKTFVVNEIDNSNAYTSKIKKSLKARPKSAHAQRKQFLEVLTAPANAVEPKVLARNMEQQNHLESRDPMTVFQHLKENLIGAKNFKLRSDGYGTKQELDLRNAIKKVDGLGSRALGMAIVFDPSIVTQGFNVVLRFKYILDVKRIQTHTTSNVGNGNRQNAAAANFAASKGLAEPFAEVGRLQRSLSMHAMTKGITPEKSRASSFVRQPSKSSNNLLNLASKETEAVKDKKKFGKQKRKPTTVEVDYQLNTSRKCHYDLKLTTNPKARSHPDVNGMPMFLPGWEGCLPLFIPQGFALCQVLVCPEGEEGTWPPSPSSPMSPSPYSSRPSTAQSSRPTSALPRFDLTSDSACLKAPPSGAGILFGATTARKTDVLDELKDESLRRPEKTISLTGFAFPADSVYKALHMLKKELESGVRKQLSNLMVPGGEPALHVAALHGNAEVCRSILRAGANVNLKNQPNLLTALHEAVIGGSRDCVEVLLEFGANEAQLDRLGNSALHLASETGDISCASLLMRSRESAKVLIHQNKAGKTPLDVVANNTVRETIERGMRTHFIVVPSQGAKKKSLVK